MRQSFLLLFIAFSALLIPRPAAAGEDGTRLGVQGMQFTLNGKPVFLTGISAYAALGAPRESLERDLDEMRRLGFNWLRVWATWAAFGNDVSAVDGDGKPREEYLERLRRVVAACDRRGLVVDVTLSRGNGVTGPSRLATLEAHRRAVETIARTLKPYRNWYLDLSNERNIRDRRFTSFADLKELRQAVRTIDPDRLVTASHAGDIGRDDLREYLETVKVDFISPHRPRNEQSPAQTEAKSREYLGWMKEWKHEVPLHYQEPFRRSFGKWQPAAEDFLTDLRAARKGGAAGWCLHNGDTRDRPDGRPRRSFDLRDHRLFEGLDDEEQKVVQKIRDVTSP
jgi:endo-1,4-beta-mannosidase